MTLVAYLAGPEGNTPILIGDLLTSRIESPAWVEDWVLPTGKIDSQAILERSGGYAPFGLVQKIAILHERVAVAFSGGARNIPTIQDAIRSALARKGVSLATVIGAISPDLLKDDELSVITLVIGDKGELQSAKYGAVLERLEPGLGKAWAMGSGVRHFFDALRRVRVSGREVQEAGAAHLALRVVTELVRSELGSQSASKALFGGAYEICVVREGKFQKLDRLVLGVFQLSLFPDGYELWPPANLIHTHYQTPEDLRISAIINHGGASTLYGTLARSAALQGAPHSAHDPTFEGDHYALRIELMDGAQRLYHWIETAPYISPDLRPFELAADPATKIISWHERYDWIVDLLEEAKTVLLARRPEYADWLAPSPRQR